jgi:hypothetical protein
METHVKKKRAETHSFRLELTQRDTSAGSSCTSTGHLSGVSPNHFLTSVLFVLTGNERSQSPFNSFSHPLLPHLILSLIAALEC